MHLVENHQLVHVPFEIELGLVQLRPVLLRLKVEVQRLTRSLDRERQRRLAHLTGTKQADRGNLVQRPRQRTGQGTLNHPCNYGV